MSEPRAIVGGMNIWARLAGPLLTFTLAILLELLARTPLHIPVPAALLLLAIIFSAIGGGLPSGLLSAAIAWVYLAYFFFPTGPAIRIH